MTPFLGSNLDSFYSSRSYRKAWSSLGTSAIPGESPRASRLSRDDMNVYTGHNCVANSPPGFRLFSSYPLYLMGANLSLTVPLSTLTKICPGNSQVSETNTQFEMLKADKP